MITTLPPELHVQVLTFLRAEDLSRLQRTCSTFNDPDLICTIIDNFANVVYPPDLSAGFDTPAIGGEVNTVNPNNQRMFLSYEALRNMEMLVVARILSRPEPSISKVKSTCGYYVSKSWIRTTLKWLDAQAEERRQREQRRLDARAAAADAAAAAAREDVAANAASPYSKKGKYNKHKQKKKSKKQERKNNKLSARLSKTLPPPLNVNHDITCEHGFLKASGMGTVNGGDRTCISTSRAKRRLLDKQAWKVLKKLYPHGAQLSSLDGECLQCTMEVETVKRNAAMRKQKLTEERKKPLSCPLVRGFYCRRSGVPKDCLVFEQDSGHSIGTSTGFTGTCSTSTPSKVARKCPPSLRNGAICPLVPGVYNILPRAWCHRWRKYIKIGEGGRPPAPDTSACLCDGHRLPLVSPHLRAFLYGQTAALMDTAASASVSSSNQEHAGMPDSPATASPRSLPVGFAPTAQQLGGGVGNFISTPNSIATRQRTINGERIPVPRSASTSTTLTSASARSIGNDLTYLRSSGVAESEIQLQRLAMLQIDEERNRMREAEEAQARRRQAHAQMQAPVHMNANLNANDTPMSPEDTRATLNKQLDIENKVVVEIVTDEELEALEKWWPGIHSSYALKFAVVELDAGAMDIIWTTQPCNSCDASGKSSEYDFAVRNRNRSWVNNTPKKRFGK